MFVFVCLYAWVLVVALAQPFRGGKGSIRGDPLESLAYKYGTDKSKDDHKYVDLYATLFQPRRRRIQNMTELGVSMGQSLQMWHDYFPNARLYGFDLQFPPNVRDNLAPLSRLELLTCDIYNEAKVAEATASFVEESMDIIVDDAGHSLTAQQSALKLFWRFLRPGGHYILEDVDAQRGGMTFVENPEGLDPFVRRVFEENHVFWVDAHIGHRAWDKFKEVSTSKWVRDHRVHNSYAVVIRKRVGPVPPVRMNVGTVAMRKHKLVKSTVGTVDEAPVEEE